MLATTTMKVMTLRIDAFTLLLVFLKFSGTWFECASQWVVNLNQWLKNLFIELLTLFILHSHNNTSNHSPEGSHAAIIIFTHHSLLSYLFIVVCLLYFVRSSILQQDFW